MAFGDLWVCPRCRELYVEDDAMWEDPHRCPNCGASLTEDPAQQDAYPS